MQPWVGRAGLRLGVLRAPPGRPGWRMKEMAGPLGGRPLIDGHRRALLGTEPVMQGSSPGHGLDGRRGCILGAGL